jgi:hypothetical protein
MLATLPFAAVLLAVSLVAIGRSRRVTHAAPVRSLPSRAAARVVASAQLGRIGAATLAEPMRSMVTVAPANRADVALELEGMDGALLVRLAPEHIVMARGWSRGHLLLSFGESRPAYGVRGTSAPAAAGWEIHLVDVTGRVLRLHGAPGASLDEELVRVHTRIHEALLARAS